MDAEELIALVRAMQERRGKHIKVMLNHEEVKAVTFMPAVVESIGYSGDEWPEYINISSEGE